MPPNLHRPAALLLVGCALVGCGAFAYARDPLGAAFCGVVAVLSAGVARELRRAS